MERTIGLRPVREFAEPRAYPQYQPFQRGPLALSYDPYYVAPTTETDDDRDDRHGDGEDPARHRRRDDDETAVSP